MNESILDFLQAKVDNALALCYNDARLTAIDVLLDLKNELKIAKEMIGFNEELETLL